jgi:hypothetical protein
MRPSTEPNLAPAIELERLVADPQSAERAKWIALKRTLRHLMIAAAILGVAAALLFLVVADAMCIGDLCRSDP